MASGFVLGIDGGGSKTTVILANAQGQVQSRGTSGASNYLASGWDEAVQAVESAITSALAQAGADSSQIVALAMGMAGVDRPDDRVRFTQWLEQRFPGVPYRLASDAHLVLAAGAGEEAGLAIISGTGSIAYAQDDGGNTARAGGWGYLLGDEGSGYSIGISGLRAVTQAWDGIIPATQLTAKILSMLGLSTPPDLVGYTYARSTGRAEIARLAALVIQCAEEGDPAASQIIKDASQYLALFAVAAARKLQLPDHLPAAMAGGILVNSPYIRGLITQSAQSMSLLLDPVTVVTEPAAGAVRLAVSLLPPVSA